MLYILLAIIILVGIVSIFLLKKSPAKAGGQLSADDFEIIELIDNER